ncbi:MAG: pilus assembly protein [Shimia sp.]|uniref:TadE/TadG family type IV pilus assembly protein n=1 Tax=Shimia sp. TaxID=1954381 RepID=UPI003B8D6A63
MIYSVLKKARSLLRKEDGAVTVDFVIMVPFYLSVFLASAELGLMSLRYAYLERSLDVAVRDIRLSTGHVPSHDDLVQQICDQASVIPDCTSNLSLQMIQRDPRNWEELPEASTCGTLHEDNADVDPVVRFDDGEANEMMFLRACASVRAIFPGALFVPVAVRNADGEYALVVENTFVQEPR